MRFAAFFQQITKGKADVLFYGESVSPFRILGRYTFVTSLALEKTKPFVVYVTFLPAY